MKTFSIAELEQYSLIKAHTFRTWEQRFGIFKSRRRMTNIRYYTVEDLAFLLDFSLLNRFGYKVSKLAFLDKHTIREKVLELNEAPAKHQHQINQLIVCMFSFNIEDFELILDSSVSIWGTDETIEQIILPFLERIEFFSYKGRTSGEYHFAVTALRKKLSVAIAQAKPNRAIEKSALLFLPQGEHYDLLLLYMDYKLRRSGLNVLYLGTNVSMNHLQQVIQKKQPDFVITYIYPKGDVQKDIPDCITGTGADTYYFVTGANVALALPHRKARCVPYRQLASEVLALAS